MSRYIRFVLPLLALLIAACGSVATPVWSEQAQGTQAALVVTAEHLTEIAPTATPLPPTETPTPLPPTPTPVPPTATATVEQPTATTVPPTETPASVAQALAGNVENGQVLFNEVRGEVNFACATCHYPNQEAQLIGPGLLNVSVRAETRVEGVSAADYLHQSIVEPGAYVVEGYPDGLMPQIYAQIFTEEQIQDIIAYLYTLK